MRSERLDFRSVNGNDAAVCGVAGILNDELDADVEVARRMASVQRHRGPDAIGAVGSGRFAASHVRLSIVDLSEAGDQPFTDGERVLVFNGEIYNHADLRPKLQRLGARFRGSSDTATLFEALRLLGVETTLRRIRGMFAFAYYEVENKTLYLCRDRIGIKPLHYLRRGGDFYFSSEVKGIAAAVPVSLDPIRAVFSIASVADDSLDRTAFRGVRQVAPGTMLVCRSGEEPVERRYYAPVEDLDAAYYRELDSSSEAVLVRRFGELLQHAVDSMLMSDARLGVFVSGGIDSSVIAALARRSSSDLPLFTSNVVGPDSEVDDARLLARSIGCDLHESRFEQQTFLDEWARSTWHYEYPIVRHMNAIPFGVVAGVAREERVKAVLTGEASDELFLGYPTLLTRRFHSVARAPVEVLMALYGSVPGLREHLFPDPAAEPTSFINLLAQDYQRQRLREAAMPRLRAFLDEETAKEQYLTLQMLQEGLHSLLHRNDRMGMSRSIESRFPFLDEEVVRFGINLPARFKIHASKRFHNYKHPFLEDKWIVRAMARDHLPQPLVQKRKNGFPLSGYRSVRVAPSFFANGYVQDVLSASASTFAYISREIEPKFVARLAAVDLMGRMFELGWSVERATEHVRAHAVLAS